MPEIKKTSDIDFSPKGVVNRSPEDWRDLFIYFLMVDRFDDGKEVTPAYDPDTATNGRDPEQGKVFQGGNIKGITRRLDYIRGLGANAVWLSPIFKNRKESLDSYHGYGIQNFLDVDPHFGSAEDLKSLVNEAHKRGMYVILDIIINHTGNNWAYPGDNPYYYWKEAPGPFPLEFWRETDPAEGLQWSDDGVWPMEFQNPDWYKRRGEIRNWSDPAEYINGDFMSLKELEINRQDTLDALIKSYKYWIAYADVDGFRLDTVKHMENTATAVFCNAMHEYAKSIGKQRFFIFGEIVDNDWTIQSYLGRNARFSGTNERIPSLDAALDFPLYFMLEEVIKGLKSPEALRSRYDRFHTMYTDHGEAGKNFVTFVDNHDQMSRPHRRFMHGNPYPAQAVQAIGYLLTSQGVPCIYYGTEQGFDGGGGHDSFVRECMFGGNWGAFDTTGCHFFDPNNEIYKGIAKIAALRQAEPALRYGRQYFRQISGNSVDFGHPLDGNCTLAYSRVLDTTEIIVAMNLSMDGRDDCICVDWNLSSEGTTMINLLDPAREYEVKCNGYLCYVKVPLERHEMAILKRK